MKIKTVSLKRTKFCPFNLQTLRIKLLIAWRSKLIFLIIILSNSCTIIIHKTVHKDIQKAHSLVENCIIVIAGVEETEIRWKLEQRSVRVVAIQFCGDLVYRQEYTGQKGHKEWPIKSSLWDVGNEWILQGNKLKSCSHFF